MSKMLRALRTLVLACVFVCLTAVPALAEGYEYTVRIFPGNRGTLPQDPVSYKIPQGEGFTFDSSDVHITDNKYCYIGLRLSGTDTLYGNATVNSVTEDMDFVVAYGVKADAVTYTLKFVEYETGKELSEAKTYYGRPGDKPVAAYEYIEGYRPLYLAITGTLSENDDDNVWTFEYIPIESGESRSESGETQSNTSTVSSSGGGTTATTTTSTVTTTTSTEGTETEAADGTVTNGTATEGTGTDGAGTEGQNGSNDDQQDTSAAPETQELLDLDNPLAGPGSGVTDDGAHDSTVGGNGLFSNKLFAAAAALGLAALLVLGFFLIKKRNEKREA